MKRKEKEEFVAQFREELSAFPMVVVVNRAGGITVEEITKLRRDVRQTGSQFKVLKNTLARVAVKDTSLEVLREHLEGSTGLAYTDNPVGLSKVLMEFAEESEKMTILGGIMDGKAISKNVVEQLAKVPPMDELRAKIIGMLTANATKIARIIKEPAGRVARVVAARARQ